MTAAIITAYTPQRDILALTVALGGAWFMGWHLAWQLSRLDIDNPTTCLRLFRSNRDAGLIPVLFLAISALL
jgi:4-hydroxybenzoate polyprenyltransferase